MPEVLTRPQAPWALRLVPPLPAIAQRILALVNRDDVNAHQVGELVKMDPSFSAELLRFANSALFGARREVDSLQHAIVLVGMDRVKTIAMFVAVNRMVRSSVRVQALRKVWSHSLTTALVAEEAAGAFHVPRETAYTLGLLHNLGALGLMSAYPDEYARMIEVSHEYGFDMLDTERELFEIDHCAAGAHLAHGWDFPEEMVAAIACHHDEPSAGEQGLSNLIRVSWRLSDTLGFAALTTDKPRAYDDLIACFPKKVSSWLTESAETAQRELSARLEAAAL